MNINSINETKRTRSVGGRRLLTAGIVSTTVALVGCGHEAPEAPTEFDESGVNGTLGGGFVQRTVATHDLAPTSDGSDDPDLAATLRMPGARRAFAYKSHATVAELQRADVAAPPNGSAGESVYVGLVTAKGHYRIEFDAAAYQNTFGPTESPADTSTEPRGWSEAIDNRVRTTGTVSTRVGQVTSAIGTCSGATIGRRLVRTAAHCVIQHTTGGGSPVASATYNQARSGTFIRATDTTSRIIYGGQYISKGCGTRTAADQNSGFRANVNGCVLEDWALLILGPNWFSEAPSTAWFTPVRTDSSDVGELLDSQGYPGCDDTSTSEGTMPHDPAGCFNNPNSHYRDTSARCTHGSFLSGTTTFRSGCDSSPGNSGGPVIRRGTTEYLGSLSWADCGTCTSTNLAPNRYIGHNQFLIDFQNQINAENP
jgi:hypothetical protein